MRTIAPLRTWANVPIRGDDGANILVFSTGVGDGCYASYFGLDAAGRALCLATDFLLRDRAEPKEQGP